MVSRLYKLGQDIDIMFVVEGNPTTVPLQLSASAKVYDSASNQISALLRPTVVNRTVALVIPAGLFTEPGDYTVVFALSDGLKPPQDIPIYFALYRHPTDNPVATIKLNPQSSNIDVETALGQGTRADRRSGASNSKTLNSIRAKTGRDMLPTALLGKRKIKF